MNTLVCVPWHCCGCRQEPAALFAHYSIKDIHETKSFKVNSLYGYLIKNKNAGITDGSNVAEKNVWIQIGNYGLPNKQMYNVVILMYSECSIVCRHHYKCTPFHSLLLPEAPGCWAWENTLRESRHGDLGIQSAFVSSNFTHIHLWS